MAPWVSRIRLSKASVGAASALSGLRDDKTLTNAAKGMAPSLGGHLCEGTTDAVACVGLSD